MTFYKKCICIFAMLIAISTQISAGIWDSASSNYLEQAKTTSIVQSILKQLEGEWERIKSPISVSGEKDFLFKHLSKDDDLQYEYRESKTLTLEKPIIYLLDKPYFIEIKDEPSHLKVISADKEHIFFELKYQNLNSKPDRKTFHSIGKIKKIPGGEIQVSIVTIKNRFFTESERVIWLKKVPSINLTKTRI